MTAVMDSHNTEQIDNYLKKLLTITKDQSDLDVKRNYKLLISRFHPDKVEYFQQEFFDKIGIKNYDINNLTEIYAYIFGKINEIRTSAVNKDLAIIPEKENQTNFMQGYKDALNSRKKFKKQKKEREVFPDYFYGAAWYSRCGAIVNYIRCPDECPLCGEEFEESDDEDDMSPAMEIDKSLYTSHNFMTYLTYYNFQGPEGIVLTKSKFKKLTKKIPNS